MPTAHAAVKVDNNDVGVMYALIQDGTVLHSLSGYKASQFPTGGDRHYISYTKDEFFSVNQFCFHLKLTSRTDGFLPGGNVLNISVSNIDLYTTTGGSATVGKNINAIQSIVVTVFRNNTSDNIVIREGFDQYISSSASNGWDLNLKLDIDTDSPIYEVVINIYFSPDIFTYELSESEFGNELHFAYGLLTDSYINLSYATVQENETKKTNSLLGNIKDGISNLFNSVAELPLKLWEKIETGLKSLFIPSEEDLVATKDKWEDLLSSRFGAVYESTQIIDDWANAFTYSDTKDIIEVPEVSVDLAGIHFSFGGWFVDVVPNGFEFPIQVLKGIINIVCTYLFVNGMRKRLEGLLS